ncbi:MAG: hypothetical protein AAFQ92_27305 [Bacteroidota bacterium]
MKVPLLITLAFMAFQISLAQVATIKDPDGWTNVRSAPNRTADIIHKVYENDVFWYYIENSDQDWVQVYIPKDDYCMRATNQPDMVGYIHKSRLLPLEDLEEYTGNDFTFEYEVSVFDPTDRILDQHDGQWITSIDGRPVWGTDGNLPRTQVDNIAVTLDGQEIDIHRVFYSDIYECDNRFTVYKNGDTYFVYQGNSDGAGFYEIVWVIDRTGLKQRLVGSII